MYRNDNDLRATRADAFEGMAPLVRKMADGNRLSAAEKADFVRRQQTVSEIDTELRARDAAAASHGDGSASAPIPAHTAEERAWHEYVRSGRESAELRAAGEASGSAGGYLVPPGWWQRLQVALKAYGGIANDFQVVESETGQPMQWATMDPTSIAATLLAENTAVSTQDYTFGQGTMGAYAFTNGVQLVSLQLANDAAFNIDQVVTDRIGEAVGRAVATTAISGTGSSQPLGVIPALNVKGAVSAGGSGGFLNLNVGQTITEFSGYAGTATEVGANTLAPSTLLRMVASVDRAYRAQGAKWYFNDLQVLGLRAQVDGYGRPLYDSLQDDLTPKLLGYPVVIDPSIPNITASTTGGPIFGHMPSAMIFRRVATRGQWVNVLRLDQRYADALQIGFIGFSRFDMRSNDLRAAVTVKAGAS